MRQSFSQTSPIFSPSNPTAQGVTISLPLEKRDDYDNLMLLCQEHHRLIDQQPHRFTVERLRQMKADHERRIRQVTGCGNC